MRDLIDCSGVWIFKADPEGIGFAHNWPQGFTGDLDCAVPGSWNEQLQEYGLMNYVGSAWYQKEIFIPSHFKDRIITLRVGSADFQAKAWVNGHLVVENEILCLPFEGNIDAHVTPGRKALIIIWVSNRQPPESITPSVEIADYINENRIGEEQYPATRPDFFPYGGIQRPVLVYCHAKEHIKDIRVQTRIVEATEGKKSIENVGILSLSATVTEAVNARVAFALCNGQGIQADVIDGVAAAEISIASCRFWSPDDPYLYTVTTELFVGDDITDSYETRAGIREIEVKGNALYLNGEKIFLRGFGKHEDFPVHGRGLNLPLMIKDFALMNWVGANSFRTSHYPYAEEILDYADQKGILVISELPSVNLDFRSVSDQTLSSHLVALEAQVARDKNHPSVIIWSLANEPGYLGEPEYKSEKAHHYWQTVCAKTRELDATRPVTLANVGRIGVDDPAFDYVDLISINRYYGWYDMPGQLERAGQRLKQELNDISEKYNKPILVSEFGADTLAGAHSTSDQMYTEEYQAKFIETYCNIIEAHDGCIGAHVWNFADFRTAQHHRRVIYNLKGIFTRTREPKRAAFTLKDLWATLHSYKT